MNNFYRLSITETAATLEVVVQLPDYLSKDKSESVLQTELSLAATEAVRERMIQLHKTLPPGFPAHFQFEIEPYPNFNPDSLSPNIYRYATGKGARVWITKPTSMLVY